MIRYLRFSFMLAVMTVTLPGCASLQSAPPARVMPPPQTSAGISPAQEQPAPPAGTPVQQCRLQLEAIKQFDDEAFISLNREFSRAGAKTKRYMAIQSSMDSELNAIALPRYESLIRELCFRVKVRLSQLIIDQA